MKKNLINTKKSGAYFEFFGSGCWMFERNMFGELDCITYEHHNKARVEKIAKKYFPHYTIGGCEELGYKAYFFVK